MARVIVVSGTLGAGKTYTADALRDVLVARGHSCGVVDLDWLSQRDPAPTDDPYNDRLGFANLAAIWPNYEVDGVDYLILARVVEDPDDRARYQAALPGCEVRIVLVEASSATRIARLTARMPAGPWLDRHIARTDDLAETLRASALEDLIVENERPGDVVAKEVLTRLDW